MDKQPEDKKSSLRLATKKSLRNQVASLQQDVRTLQSSKKKLNDKYIRALADTQNLRHQADSEEHDIKQYDGESIAKALLPELDNLKRALNTKTSSPDAESLKKGVKMVLHNTIRMLRAHNIEPVHVLGKTYDPHYAQAVHVVSADTEHPSESVVKVLRTGYKMHNRIIRPAIVVITK